jgi:hypothetical protein
MSSGRRAAVALAGAAVGLGLLAVSGLPASAVAGPGGLAWAGRFASASSLPAPKSTLAGKGRFAAASVGSVSNPAPTAVEKGPDSVALISQSPWVTPEQASFQLRLQVSASDEADEALAIVVYGGLFARSQFQAALSGKDLPPIIYDPTEPLADLRRAPGGGALVDIQVGSPGGLGLTSTGIYPVQLFVEKGGVRMSQVLTTFLVYAGPDTAHLPKLKVAVIVPLSAKLRLNDLGSPGRLSSGEARLLEGDSAVIAKYAPAGRGPSGVPVTVGADVTTLEALARQGPQGQLAIEHLGAAARSGDELLPSTALPMDVPALVGAGLSTWLRSEVRTGASELSNMLGAEPDGSTWLFPGPVDQATLATVESMGAREVVVPGPLLSPLPSTLPSREQELTFAAPTELLVPGAAPLKVFAADAELSSRLGQAAAAPQTTLVANQVLAELAMIDLEQPGNARGVVVMPEPWLALPPEFLSVLLSGLEGNPLLSAVPLSSVFRSVPTATLPSGQPLERRLAGGRTPRLAGVQDLVPAATDVRAVGAVFGSTSQIARELGQQLFVSLSSTFSTSRREALIAAVASTARAELGKIHLPPPASITLTSLRGKLPLTVLSAAGTSARVRLVLSSEQLSFSGGRYPRGICQVLGPGLESCDLVLDGPSSAIEVPVAVRTPGTFQLTVSLESPDGAVALSNTTDTVRSLVAPGLGLALMIGAALFLAVWWARNARHGRRARQLVPRPTLAGDCSGRLRPRPRIE